MSYPVYVSALLANVPSGIVFAFTAFDLKESCVFVLVPQTTFEASENCLGIEPSALRCHTGNSAKIIKLVILSGFKIKQPLSNILSDTTSILLPNNIT